MNRQLKQFFREFNYPRFYRPGVIIFYRMQCPPHATTDRIYPDASKPVQSPQIIVEFCFLCSALFTRSLIFISKLESTTYHVIFFCVSKYICIGFSVIFCQILVSDLYVGFSVIFVKSSFVLRVCGFCGEADCFHPQLIDAHSKLVFLMYKYTTTCVSAFVEIHQSL